MTPEAPTSNVEDPLLVLSRELDKANASLERAHAAHAAVRKRLGTRAPPPSTLPRAVPRPALEEGAYRGKDKLVALQAAVDETKTAAAKLRAETSSLESECDMEFPKVPFGSTPLGIMLMLVVVMGVIGGLAWLSAPYGGKEGSRAIWGVGVLLFVLIKVFGKKSNER